MITKMFRGVRAIVSRVSGRTVAAAAAAALYAHGVQDHIYAARAVSTTPDAKYVYPSPRPEAPAVASSGVTVPTPPPHVVFVLGGPGAGKGTQCARLVSEYGYVHLSAGDLLREERDSGSADGAMITAYINEGKIVPVEVTVNLIRKAMQRSGGSKFLVDGFPRNFDNLQGWYRVMGNEVAVDGVLFYDCAESVMEARLLERGKTSGRSDDNAEVIRKRFKTYMESTVGVIKHFERQGKVFRVDADQPVGDVFKATEKVMEPLLKAEVLQATATLVDSIHAGDWATYEKLSDPKLTAIEPESNYAPVEGLDFHKYYFQLAAKRRAGPDYVPSKGTIADAKVQLLGGKAAVVSYTRMVQKGVSTENYGETRVWRYTPSGWKHVHFHRSPKVVAPATAE